ncbi:MAG TPA: hypothetical protein VFB14_27600 [Bryobacteraceae bacterium]|jgi:hypothetical protein|nr:hypothetical protein [Bryobacteraceae bacterium]
MAAFTSFLSNIGHLWCSFAHNDVMWPIHGQYQCRRCLRYHTVAWEQPQAEGPVARASQSLCLEHGNSGR